MGNLIAFLLIVMGMNGQPGYTEQTIHQAELKCEAHGGMSSVWADGAAECNDGSEVK